MSRVLDGQMSLFEARHVPGECPNEAAVADIGGGKSLCSPWGRWTNCREVGRCVYADSARWEAR